MGDGRNMGRSHWGLSSNQHIENKQGHSCIWDGTVEHALETSSATVSNTTRWRNASFQHVIWSVLNRPDAERYYNFTELACQLNEMEEGLAPTDSRKRPDQRLMEEGKWDEANDEKLRLEEKQRSARRQRELEAELAIQEGLSNNLVDIPIRRLMNASVGRPVPTYEPNWFRKEKDRYTGNMLHVFGGRYWECKRKQEWAVCPDIF